MPFLKKAITIVAKEKQGLGGGRTSKRLKKKSQNRQSEIRLPGVPPLLPITPTPPPKKRSK